MPNPTYRHIIIDDRFWKRKDYTAHRQIIDKSNPERDRKTHGQFLREKFDAAWKAVEKSNAVSHVDRNGVYIEFKSDPGAELVTKSLDEMRSQKIRLLNVRKEREPQGEVTYATVYVSNDKRSYFENKLSDYISKNTSHGNPVNAMLVESIGDIREALLIRSFWTDDVRLLPKADAEYIEVWLSSDHVGVETRFRDLCARLKIPVENGSIQFPERRVLVVQANAAQLSALTQRSDDIAEYRKAKETSAHWLKMENAEQANWVRDLLDRLEVDDESIVSVCLLDTGVNNGHPLIEPYCSSENCLAYDSSWGTDDHNGHGSLMAGVIGYGDLRDALLSDGKIRIIHHLESVKILPPDGSASPQKLWGHITAQSISLAELTAPEKKRIICLAVSSIDTRDQGRPSSWSGEIDVLSSGAIDGERRLFIVCAGNVGDPLLWENYPEGQFLEAAHDPGQAWNAVTVGAYTRLDRVTEDHLVGYRGLAPSGSLSPFSSTSRIWDDRWPLKPDIVLEGGNLAVKEGEMSDQPDSLSVLSTYYKPTDRHFEGFNMTSAAAAKASWMAAQISKRYPEFWPETIRALIVHSASWTQEMLQHFLPAPGNPAKGEIKNLIRTCGWGVPNLSRALHTAKNTLTLVSEAELQPYEKKNGGVKSRDMHLYELPWPKDVLESLPENSYVTMRVTLSYFIEPGPGEIGWKDRYRYPSHQLRFSIIRPEETPDAFYARISAAAETDPDDDTNSSSDGEFWTLGANGRTKGSLHSDIWKGSPQQLAASNALAIYPVIGWWRERRHLGRVESKCRYSFIVTIHTEDESIDIYTPVERMVNVPVETTVS